VSSTATTNESTQPKQAESKPATGRWIFFSGLILLGLTLAGSLWIYLEGTRGLRRLQEEHSDPQAAAKTNHEPSVNTVIKEVDSWVRQISLGAGAGGAGLILIVGIGVLGWRRLWLNRITRFQQRAEEVASTLQERTTEAQQLLDERKKLQEELTRITDDIDRRVQDRTAQLQSSFSQLQKELDGRRAAERQMAQQAKELERSKDVLEMHVQLRTQELQKLQKRTESILDSAGEGIYGLDLQGKINFVNPAAGKISGWKVEEMIGKFEHEVFLKGQASAEVLRKDANGEHLTDQEFYRRDGVAFPVEYVRTPIKDKERLVGAVIIFKDITERKRAEDAINRKAAELARSNAELEQFAYVASHDLQEPLRKIQAFGDRLKTKCDAASMVDGRDFLERMQGAAARMQTLINDLLTFSRVISSSQPFTPVELAPIIKGVLSDLEVRIEQTKATVEVGELPTIDADATQMRQLFQNLVGNALKFQPANHQPVIRISAKVIKSPFAGTPEEDPYAEQCEITVEDNGIGFEEKYLEKIFAVFQRLHGRNEYEGTGVGLAVCRRITDRHGGTITARSKPGEGACFVVTVPTRHPAQSKEELQAA
jgi:two-component system, LuxR family, sensor kinase FixL